MLLVESDGPILRLTINRLEVKNAFNDELIAELHKVFTTIKLGGTRAVILTGAGDAFCAGGDVKDFADNLPRIGVLIKELTTYLHGSVSRLCRSEKPVIMAVNGVAAGAGFSLAMAGDIVVAAESARFSTGYVRVGLVPGDGDTYFLPRLVGAAKALDKSVLAVTPDARAREPSASITDFAIFDASAKPLENVAKTLIQALRPAA